MCQLHFPASSLDIQIHVDMRPVVWVQTVTSTQLIGVPTDTDTSKGDDTGAEGSSWTRRRTLGAIRAHVTDSPEVSRRSGPTPSGNHPRPPVAPALPSFHY